MSVYCDPTVQLSPAAELQALARPSVPALDRLIRLGALEAALLDAALPERDDLVAGLAPLGRAVEAAAMGLPVPLETPDPAGPEVVTVKIAEGFAFYALHPDGYAAAGRKLARIVQGATVTVVGLRSIGTTLGACVLAGLREAGACGRRLTLRPRGPPFDRRPMLAPALAARLAAAEWIAVVDEGPGLSGSSLCGTAAVLAGLGLDASRIVLIPAHDPDPAGFRSPDARARWTAHRRIPAALDHAPPGRDLSAGAWRGFLGLGLEPPVQPQHERRKLLGEDGVIRRFAGLGPYGRPFLARAQALHDAGLGARPHGLAKGWLGLDWLDGRPCADLRPHGPAILRHLAFVARHFPTGRSADPDALAVLCADHLGRAPAFLPRDRLGAAAEVAVDGRMLAYEWIETATGVLKVDALDHHADHFAGGCRDIAWDVAGLRVEAGLDVADTLAGLLRDPDLPRRMPWHVAAYAGLRKGWAQLAAASPAAAADAPALAALAERYERAGLAALAEIERLRPAVRPPRGSDRHGSCAAAAARTTPAWPPPGAGSP